MTPEQFDKEYPRGSAFKYYPLAMNPQYEEVKTRSAAWALGDADADSEVVVKVTGRAGGVSISHLILVERATPERPPYDEDLENVLYTSLGLSHPSDRTGYYTLLRAFQHHIRGEAEDRDRGLKIASDEQVKHRARRAKQCG